MIVYGVYYNWDDYDCGGSDLIHMYAKKEAADDFKAAALETINKFIALDKEIERVCPGISELRKDESERDYTDFENAIQTQRDFMDLPGNDWLEYGTGCGIESWELTVEKMEVIE